MSVVILKWNPGFSSYTMVRFLKDLEKCALANNDVTGMNWSVWDYDQVRKGDIFYMLKVGYGQTGIVARGTITSDPYQDDDWSWRDRPTRYCDLDFDVMVNPDAYPILDSKSLSRAIPDFDWTGGHSGVVLPGERADVLGELWNTYMARQADYFNNASDHNLFFKTSLDLKGKLPYTMELDDCYDGNRLQLKYTKEGMTTSLRISNFERVLGKFGVKSWRMLQLLFLERYPTLDSMQGLCGDLFKHQIEFEAEFYKIVDDDDDDDD